MLDIELTRPERLTDNEWQTWTEVQQQAPGLESPYFRPEFTQAVAAVRDDVEVALLRERGHTVGFFPFQRGALNLGKPVGGKLSDYQGVVVRPETAWNAEKLIRACGLAGWDFDHLVAVQTPFAPYVKRQGESPCMDVGDGFEAYASGRRAAGSDSLNRIARKIRKMEREQGELTFSWHDPSEDVFHALLDWKSAQYRASGLADLFLFPWTVALLKELSKNSGPDFGAVTSVLRLGDRPVAICYSLRSRNVLHSWFNAYDHEFSAYSPGLALFERMARGAAENGVAKIDLGKGDELYKQSLASSAAPLVEGSVELQSLSVWLRSGWRRTRDWVNTSPLAGAAKVPGQLARPLRQWLAFH